MRTAGVTRRPLLVWQMGCGDWGFPIIIIIIIIVKHRGTALYRLQNICTSHLSGPAILTHFILAQGHSTDCWVSH